MKIKTVLLSLLLLGSTTSFVSAAMLVSDQGLYHYASDAYLGDLLNSQNSEANGKTYILSKSGDNFLKVHHTTYSKAKDDSDKNYHVSYWFENPQAASAISSGSNEHKLKGGGVYNNGFISICGQTPGTETKLHCKFGFTYFDSNNERVDEIKDECITIKVVE